VGKWGSEGIRGIAPGPHGARNELGVDSGDKVMYVVKSYFNAEDLGGRANLTTGATAANRDRVMLLYADVHRSSTHE